MLSRSTPISGVEDIGALCIFDPGRPGRAVIAVGAYSEAQAVRGGQPAQLADELGVLIGDQPGSSGLSGSAPGPPSMATLTRPWEMSSPAGE